VNELHYTYLLFVCSKFSATSPPWKAKLANAVLSRTKTSRERIVKDGQFFLVQTFGLKLLGIVFKE
jgi:hypothetical protein